MVRESMLECYYNFSEDYKELYDIVKKGKAVFAVGQVPKDEHKDLFQPVTIREIFGKISCGTLGLGYFDLYDFEIEKYASEFEAFKWHCEYYKIRWIKNQLPCRPKKTDKMVSDEDVYNIIDDAIEAGQVITEFENKTYEQGVAAALFWIMGQGVDPING